MSPFPSPSEAGPANAWFWDPSKQANSWEFRYVSHHWVTPRVPMLCTIMLPVIVEKRLHETFLHKLVSKTDPIVSCTHLQCSHRTNQSHPGQWPTQGHQLGRSSLSLSLHVQKWLQSFGCRDCCIQLPSHRQASSTRIVVLTQLLCSISPFPGLSQYERPWKALALQCNRGYSEGLTIWTSTKAITSKQHHLDHGQCLCHLYHLLWSNYAHTSHMASEVSHHVIPSRLCGEFVFPLPRPWSIQSP